MAKPAGEDFVTLETLAARVRLAGRRRTARRSTRAWPRSASAHQQHRDLHAYLVQEHSFSRSLRNVQCYVRAAVPPPKVPARRRADSSPGAHELVDWTHLQGVLLGGRQSHLLAFSLVDELLP